MRVLCIGDPHFRLDNAIETDTLQRVVIEWLANNPVDQIVVLGDILDKHELTDTRPLRRAHEFLLALAKYALTYCLIGNHDILNDNQWFCPFHPLIGFDLAPPANLKIINTPTTVDDLVYVPYVPKNRFREALALAWPATKEGKPRMIFAHQEINGAQMGAIVSDIKEVWLPEDPPVVSGHIHDYQQVHPNWLYPGTPFPHSFGETPRKTVSLITLEADGSWAETRLPLMLPGKCQERLTVAEATARLTGWQPELNMRYKWKVSGPRVECDRFNKQAQWGPTVKLDFEYTDVMRLPPPQTGLTRRSFVEILNERVAGKPLVHAYFSALVAASQTR